MAASIPSTSLNPGKYMSKLQGTRVLIIGGSSGIGFGVAEALLEYGASVIISSSSQERVARAVQRLTQKDPATKARVEGYTCDLGSQDTVESEVANLFSQVGRGGKLDHVVYTAGDGVAVGTLEKFTLKEIQQAGMVRFFSPFIVGQHLRKYLKDGPASSYIMTGNGASERPLKDWAVVIAYGSGLEGMCRALAKELAPARVNLIGLGPVETEMWDGFKQQGTYDAFKAGFEKTMATKQIGRVEDVVESYLYLMKDQNITGSVVISNGGTILM